MSPEPFDDGLGVLRHSADCPCSRCKPSRGDLPATVTLARPSSLAHAGAALGAALMVERGRNGHSVAFGAAVGALLGALLDSVAGAR